MQKNENACSLFKRNQYKSVLLKKMKLITIFFLVGTLAASATSYSQVTKINLSFTDSTSLTEILGSIEKTSEFIFAYDASKVNMDAKRTLMAKEEKIEAILNNLFQGTKITWLIDDRQIFLYEKDDPKITGLPIPKTSTVNQQPQTRNINGTVTDSKGQPIVGATVILKGTVLGKSSDVDGKFLLTVPADAKTLVISFIGMKTQEVDISGIATVSVQMEEASIGLEEVVVIGFGVQKKATVTGSIVSVDNKLLLQSPKANISESLVGRMPGLLTVQREGQPGADQATLRVRGSGTFAGSTDPLIMVDGIEAVNYNNIDPNEIEKITMLKDASATAVYGVRGANGVLLITTKRGSKGAPVISASSSVAATTYTDLVLNMGSYDWARYFNEALRYASYFTGSYTPKFTDADLEHYRTGDDPIFHPNTDWIHLMMKPVSFQSQTNLNISGGTDDIKYFISAGYFDQGGLFKSAELANGFDAQINYKRYNFRSNFDFNITKRFSVSINTSSQIETRIFPTQRISYIVDKIYDTPPNCSPGIVDGKIINVYTIFAGNPLERLLGYGFTNQLSNYLTGTIRLNHDLDFITKGLTVHGTLSYWNYMTNSKTSNRQVQTYKPILTLDNKILFAPEKEEAPFSFSESTGKNRKNYLEFGLDYSRSFGKHSFTGLLLYNQSKLYDPSLLFVVPNGYQGIVGRATYNYSGRYMAEFNLGYNGTENFAPGKRFGFFPAYSLGWTVTEEPFFPKNKVITYLKIRGSYGEVGNDKVGGTRFLYRPAFFSFTGSYNFGEVGSTYQSYPASAEGTLGNPNLTWERAKKTDIGADITLWDNKIQITTDFFLEKRDNILITPATTPDIVGIALATQNWGKMKNSGYEAEITYNGKIGNFSYWLRASNTYAHNVILFQDEVKRPFTYQNRTGQSSGQSYGLIVEGYYNTWEDVNNANRPASQWDNNLLSPGDFKFKDVNGDGIVNSDDQVPIGYPDFPEIMYAFSFGGNLKGFDFSVLFQGTENVSRSTWTPYVRPYNVDLCAKTFLLDWMWTQERYEKGLPIKMCRISPQTLLSHSYQNSTFMRMDASYLRLKNVEIGYNFTNNFLKRMNISSSRIYINCSNLFTWCGLLPGDDPEQTSASNDFGPYPITRVANLGFNIKF
jgi:TonB-linked SusC/RagA family outer membrane protein